MLHIFKKISLRVITITLLSGVAHGMEGINLDDARFKAVKPSPKAAIKVAAAHVTLTGLSAAFLAIPNSGSLGYVFCGFIGGNVGMGYISTSNMIRQYQEEKDTYNRSDGLNIHGAAAHNNAHAVRILEKRKTRSVLHRDDDDRIPHHFAAHFGADRSLQQLLEDTPIVNFGGSLTIDTQDRLGRTPLLYAALGGRLSTCKILLKANANGYKADNQGTSFLTLANGNQELKSMWRAVRLEQAGVQNQIAPQAWQEVQHEQAVRVAFDAVANIPV